MNTATIAHGETYGNNEREATAHPAVMGHLRMSTPVVSVIIPTFNRAKFLPLSVGSVRQQTFADWELLVIDDGSSDETREIVSALQREDPRVQLLANERRKGPAGARNTGVQRARGKYIAFLDSDDAWEPFHLRDTVYYLEKYPDELDALGANPVRKNYLTGDVIQQDEIDVAQWPLRRLEDLYLFSSEQAFDLGLRSRLLLMPTIVAKREVLLALPMDENLLTSEDIFMVLEMAHRRYKIGHLQRYHVVIWIHDDNLTNCGGRHEAARRVPVNLSIEAYYRKVLQSFPLTPDQTAFVRRRLADHCAWMLAYQGFLPLGDYRRTREYLWKAIRLRPWHASYWKTYASTFVKQLRRQAATEKP